MPDTFSLNARQLTSVLAEFSIVTSAIVAMENFVAGELINDTRKLKAGDVFCAVIGHQQNGRDYIEQAITKNVALVIAETCDEKSHGQISYQGANNTPVLEFYRLNNQLYHFSSLYYQKPQSSLSMIGITGTNGKTTTSHIIAQLLEATANHCAVIGTLGAGRIHSLQPTENTTPAATELFRLFNGFVREKVTHVTMEVSSHALAQRRVSNELFDIVVFSNLSRDHLDYHQTMAEYAQAKFRIFSQSAEQIAIVNADDKQVQQWLAKNAIKQPLCVFGKERDLSQFSHYVMAKNMALTNKGMTFTAVTHIGNIEITSAILGEFNIDNLLAAIAVLVATGVPLVEIEKACLSLKAIAGRMETFHQDNQATAVVDYAHTPEALENALQACRKHCQGDLWVVFGCGGDRDHGKRSIMGKIAQDNADRILITNDNPRNEAPQAIADDILSGCAGEKNISVVLDRQQAVLSALSQAASEDIILLAGKGHEKNIIIGENIIAYNEREFVGNYYSNGALS